VLLRKLLRLLEAAARRHGENHLARGGVDAQRIASGLAMTAQAHEINRFVEDDLNDRGLARTAIEQRAKRHGSTLRATPEEILPYEQAGAARSATNKGASPSGGAGCDGRPQKHWGVEGLNMLFKKFVQAHPPPPVWAGTCPT